MIGIMTYHAAHNYGSVLQAYATQTILQKLGYSSEIINYRLRNQKAYYNDLYSLRFGNKNFLRRLMKLPEHRKASLRSRKFENFISERLILTEKEYTEYNDLLVLKDRYSVLMSGSDQVWNEHCTAEFQTEPPESILGYYLAFGSDAVKRIAFSSSFGGMREDEILKYKEYLAKYDFLSCREQTGANMLSELLGGEVINTLDPTLVLSRDEWEIDGVYNVDKDYIFVYTLKGYRGVQAMLKDVVLWARREGLKVICVAPFSPVHVAGIEAFADCGPLDFLSYIKNAKLVITDSFHGTAFAVNFGVPFYSIQADKDQRKAQLLNKLGMAHRILSSSTELSRADDYDCDFTETWRELDDCRKTTVQFLREALETCNAQRG